MTLISVIFRGSLTTTVVLIAGLCVAHEGAGNDLPVTDDGWRRTANGWELWPRQPAMATTRLATKTVPRLDPLPFPGSAHPAAWAGLQLSLSLLALGFFPSSEE